MLHIVVFLLTAVCWAGALDECPEWRCRDRQCSLLTQIEMPIDLVFLLDGSESITSENFNISLEWVLTTVDLFKPMDRTDGLNVYLVQYSWNATLESNRTVHVSSNEIRNDVGNIIQMASGTRAYGSLDYVNKEVIPSTRNGAFKILITLTDGRSHPEDQTADKRKQIIDTAKENFDIMVAVSVGVAINDEIRDFASGSEPINVAGYIALQNTSVSTRIVNSATTASECGDLYKCEPKPLKLVFLIDGSESITTEDFQNSLQWILKTVNDVKPVDRNVTRVVVVQYSERATKELDRYVQSSAEEIRGAVEGISQIRQGTNPYTALRYVNDISLPDRSSFYDVLITLSDGLSRKEARDLDASNDAIRLFDMMVAVSVGNNQHTDILKDFAGDNLVMGSKTDQRIPGIINDIIRESHEACIEFTAGCTCVDDTTVEVNYNTILRGPITSESQIISEYVVTNSRAGNSYIIPLGTTKRLFTGLHSDTEFSFTVDGYRNTTDKCAVIQSHTTTCRSGVLIQPVVYCDPGETELTLWLYHAYLPLLERYDVELLQGGNREEMKTVARDTHRTTFERLRPSTSYNVTVRPYANPNTCATIVPAHVHCVTKVGTTTTATTTGDCIPCSPCIPELPILSTLLGLSVITIIILAIVIKAEKEE